MKKVFIVVPNEGPVTATVMGTTALINILTERIAKDTLISKECSKIKCSDIKSYVEDWLTLWNGLSIQQDVFDNKLDCAVHTLDRYSHLRPFEFEEYIHK